jgi:adenylate cyclase class IV
LIKLVSNSFQIKLKDRSTATNLLDEELLKDVIKKSKKRREERKGSILLEIARVIDYCRYTTIKVENRESKKGKRLRKTRRFTI